MLKREIKLFRDRIRNLSASARQHRQRSIDFYSQFVGSGDLCFDVGANLGNRTEVFLALGARVVAVEPQEFCGLYLKRRFGKNPNLTIIPKALGDKPGVAEMNVSKSHTLSSLSADWIGQVKASGRFADYEWDHRQTVTLTTLDELIREHGRPVFCKIDVEGFEYEVLKGLNSPINALSIEFSRECLETTKRCLEHLQGLGQLTLNSSPGETMEFDHASWLDADRLCQYLETLDLMSWGDLYARLTPRDTA